MLGGRRQLWGVVGEEHSKKRELSVGGTDFGVAELVEKATMAGASQYGDSGKR